MFLATDDVEEFTAELVGKMEHFEIGHEKVSGLKTVAIKLEVSDGRELVKTSHRYHCRRCTQPGAVAPSACPTSRHF